jgi:hypothetical protein
MAAQQRQQQQQPPPPLPNGMFLNRISLPANRCNSRAGSRLLAITKRHTQQQEQQLPAAAAPAAPAMEHLVRAAMRVTVTAAVLTV